MPSKTTKSKSFKVAYYLNKHGFDRIIGILNEVSTELKVSIKCSDGCSIEFSSPNELFEFANAESRRIESLSLTTPWNKETNISVRFRSSKYLTPIEYEISGDDKNVFYYSGKLDECISTYRLWYTRIAFMDFTDVLFVSIVIAIFGFLLWAFFTLLTSDSSRIIKNETTSQEILGQVVAYLSLGSLFLIGAGANFFRNRLFPFANFLIGEGETRFNKLEFRRRTLGIGFILSVIASVVATLLIG